MNGWIIKGYNMWNVHFNCLELNNIWNAFCMSITPKPVNSTIQISNCLPYCWFPGGRGLKMEVWNDTRYSSLPDIFSYNESRSGYWTQWIDTLPQVFPFDLHYFSTRTRGFFVPPETGNYTFYVQCDDRCELHFSNSSDPEDMVNSFLTDSVILYVLTWENVMRLFPFNSHLRWKLLTSLGIPITFLQWHHRSLK